MSERVDVATRLRTLADAPWVARGDAATQAALREGADEVERLAGELDATQAMLSDVARSLPDAVAAALQRERELCEQVAELRAELDFTRRQREGDGDLIRRMSAEADEYIGRNKALRALVSGAQYREREARNEAEVLRGRLDARAQADAGDLAGLARREGASRQQWRGCHRCGQAFLLADTAVVPEHTVRVMGEERVCGWVVTVGGGEGR